MQSSTTPARPYFRTPALSPDGASIAFVYAGDIWLADAGGGRAERLTAHPATHWSPAWSPDGERLAFTSNRTGAGDIYVLPLRGGEVRRVTYHDTPSAVESWSADGEHIFFSSTRDRQGSAIYRVDAAGGTPVPWLSQPYEALVNLAVSPDGSRLAFNVSRDQWWRRGPNPYGGAEIWVASSAPGAEDFQKLNDYAGLNRWPMWAPDGAGIYFVSDRDGVENLWYRPLERGPARRVTAFTEGRLLWPSIARDGRTVVFERDFGIWRLDIPSGRAEPLDIRVRPDTKLNPVRVAVYTRDLSELALSPDGKKVAFVARGEIFADFADKETDREQRQGASFRVTSTPYRERDVAWSPDSRRLVYTSDRHGDAEVYQYDFAARRETRLTTSSRRKEAPLYSPDGAWIAYARGDDEIRLIHAESGEDRPFARGNFVYGASFAWSPDSRWLAYTMRDANFFSNLYVQRVDEDTPRQITFLSNLHLGGPLWAPNGRFIVFTTSQYRDEAQVARVDLRPNPPQFREVEFEKLFEPRPTTDDRRPATDRSAPNDQRPTTGDRPPLAEPAAQPELKEPAPPETPEERPAEAPAPAVAEERTQNAKLKTQNASGVEIVFDGIERRLRFLTPAQMDAAAMGISPDSRDLIFSAVVAGKQNLWTLPLDEPRADQPPRQLTSSAGYKSWAQFAPDGKSFYYLDGGQITVRKFPGGEQSQLQVAAEVVIDFHQEKLQIFDECWRLLRDHFYDPTFHGLDWSAARTQFAPLAAGAQTTGDLHTIVNLMVGELRASHLGVYGGWPAPRQDGYTGLLFDPLEQARSGRLVVAGIVPDSPAALAGGIAVGDELLTVDGVALGPGVSLDRLLQRTIGRRVVLRFAPASPRPLAPNPYEVALRPISADQYDYLRYRGWVYTNEAYVHRVSGGRLGYVHIREMDYESYQQFLADLDSEIHSKEGVVVDTRFNGGGHTATFILDVLARRSVLRSAYRDRAAADASHLAGNRVLNKPTVLVTNESSVSNTEMFSEGYRRLGLGKVVGRPTAGAVIWTYNRRLIDGNVFRLPQFKVATPEGEELEGKGRAVDVDVPLRLGERPGVQDSQLDAAVGVLLEQIDAQR
ncbi:MAG TPA: S41 family peptidase [Roseiflexaceae bacterium]|nr:S41 family peptidase [Roseiflexaceae bacterium]